MTQGRDMMFELAQAEDLPGILQYRLQLDDPACAAWVDQVMAALAARMPPERALGWWFRAHIALRGGAPVYRLPEGWTPEGEVAVRLLRYAREG